MAERPPRPLPALAHEGELPRQFAEVLVIVAYEERQIAIGKRARPVEVSQVVRRWEALRELLQLEIETEVPAARRQSLCQRPDDAKVHGCRQDLRGARKTLRLEHCVAVKEFVAAVAC